MDFIFDQFIELKDGEGTSWFVTASSITVIQPVEVDTCNVHIADGLYIKGVRMPARVLIGNIAQSRREGQKLLRAAVVH